MSAFRFRFAVVLKARERTRDAARGRLAAALRAFGEAEATEKAVHAAIAGDQADLAARTAGGRVDAGDWIARRRHAGTRAAELSRATAARVEAGTAVAAARSAVAAADRDVAALETLRDRDRAAHRTAEFAAEQRAAEDLFAAAFVTAGTGRGGPQSSGEAR